MNNKGFVLLPSLLILITVSLGCIKIIKYVSQSIQANQIRRKTYLCAKKLLHHQKLIMRNLAVLNISIASINASSILSPPLIKSRKALQKLQQVNFLIFYKETFSAKKCSLFQKITFLKKFPYETNKLITLKRNPFTGLPILRRKKWNFSIYGEQKGSPINMFTIEATGIVKNKFDTSTLYKTKEKTMGDLLSYQSFLSF